MPKAVIVFSTPECANCKPLKAALAAAGVAIQEVNCHETSSFDLMRRYGVRGVPTTIVTDGVEVRTVIGNKPQDVLSLLQ